MEGKKNHQHKFPEYARFERAMFKNGELLMFGGRRFRIEKNVASKGRSNPGHPPRYADKVQDASGHFCEAL